MSLKHRYVAFSIFSYIAILAPLRFLFMLENGISFTEIMLFTSIYNISKIVFALPIGAISDVLGQKLFMSLGVVFKIFFYMVFIFGGGSFMVFLLAHVFIGFADSSLEYSKKAYLAYLTRETGGFIKTDGAVSATTTLLTVSLNFASGYLYEISPVLPFKAVSIILLIPLLISLSIRNIHEEDIVEKIRYRDAVIKGTQRLVTNPSTRKIFASGIILLVFSALIITIKQPYWTSIGLSAREVGSFGGLLQLSNLIGYRAEDISNRIKKNFFSLAMGMHLVTTLFVFMVSSRAGFLIYGLTPALTTLIQLNVSSAIADDSPSEIVTTMFSYFGLLTSGVISISLIGMGVVVDNFGIHNAGFILTLIILPIFMISIIAKGRNEKATADV